MSNLAADGLQQQKTALGSTPLHLLLASNMNQRLQWAQAPQNLTVED